MDNQPQIPQNVNIQEILRKGEEIYQQQLKSTLEPSKNGTYVVIEVDSEKHFLGATKDETVLEAKKEFPDKILFVRRIGETERIASYSPNFSSSPQRYD